jgi:hypothetical protein
MAGALTELSEQIVRKFGNDPAIAADLFYGSRPVKQDGTGRKGFLLYAHPHGGIQDAAGLSDFAFAYYGDEPELPANDNAPARTGA